MRHLLYGQRNVPVRAEEIAEDVLESLLERNNERLRRYQPDRVPPGAYLRVLALQGIWSTTRTNAARRRRARWVGATQPTRGRTTKPRCCFKRGSCLLCEGFTG